MEFIFLINQQYFFYQFNIATNYLSFSLSVSVSLSVSLCLSLSLSLINIYIGCGGMEFLFGVRWV